MFKFSGKNLEEWTISRKMTRQKEQEDKAENQNGDRKGEPTDSPEIPDRGEASDIPGLPLGKKSRCTALYIQPKPYYNDTQIMAWTMKQSQKTVFKMTFGMLIAFL